MARYRPAAGWLSLAGLGQVLGALVVLAVLAVTVGPLWAGVALLAVPVWLFTSVPVAVAAVHLLLLVAFPASVPLLALLGVEAGLGLAVLGRLETTAVPRTARLGFVLAALAIGAAGAVGLWYADRPLGGAIAVLVVGALVVYGVHRYEVAWLDMEGYA